MQTQPVQPTQTILPSTQIQVQTAQNQSQDETSSAEDKRIKYLKSTARGLGKTIIVLSVFVFFMSIAEVAIKACIYDDYIYSDYGMKYYSAIDSIRCYTHVSWGTGIWCSVLPFVAGIFGVIAGSESSSQKKNGLLMGFSIAGAIMSVVLIVIQSILTGVYRYETHQTNSKFGLQIAILSLTAINMILLIVSSAYSCCLCCCGQTRKPVGKNVVYVAYDPNQPIPVQQTLGTYNYPQAGQTVFLNQHQQVMTIQPNPQVSTSAPLSYTNPSMVNLPPPNYNQVNSKVQM